MFDDFKVFLTDDKAYPKYLQLRDQLEEYIKQREVPPGEQLPDILTMCRTAGLSNRSVERAYITLINDGVCFRRPKKGTFVRGSSPVRGEAKPRICAIFSPADPMHLEKDDVTGRIYHGIQQEARRAKLDLLILSERSLSFYVDNSSIDLVGVIMLSWYSVPEAQAVVRKYPNIRFLFLNYRPHDFDTMPANACGIFNDDLAGGFEATEYLISRNRRKLRAITIELPDDNYNRRIEGFLLAARLNHLDIGEEQVYRYQRAIPSRDEQFAIGRELFNRVIEEDANIDGIFCTNDLLAAGVASALDKRGLRDQIELIGYDNLLPYLSANGHFSTVAIRQEQMGERAIKQLLDPRSDYPKIINVAPQLLPRSH